MGGTPPVILADAMLLCLTTAGCDSPDGEPAGADAQAEAYVPDCTKKQCGPDGCGGICGVCKPFQHCSPISHRCFSGECMSGFSRNCCVGEVLLMCPGSRFVVEDCSGRPRCGWSTMSKIYQCNTDGGEDPSGKYARSCDDR